jgi:hypothetical protein
MTYYNSSTTDLSALVQKKLKGAKINYPEPNEEVLNKLFETLFYTSLKTEEGQFIKVTVTIIDPNNPDPSPPKRIVSDRWKYVKFQDPIEFSVKNLVKLSKAADVWSSSLAVYYDNKNNLTIWGMVDQAVHNQSFLNYEAESGPEQPGLFQSTIVGIGNIVVLFDYELIANLKQNTLISNYIDVFRRGAVNEIIERKNSNLRDKISSFIEQEYPDEEREFWISYADDIFKQTIIRILLRIQNYQHGGALLITDKIKSDLDIKYKIEYDRLPDSMKRLLKLLIKNTTCSNIIHNEYLETEEDEMPVSLYLDEDVSRFEKEDTRSEVKGAIRFVASLSCVDGLVVLDNSLKVQGFGAVIKTNDLPEVVYISKTSLINERRLIEVNPNNLGTRHRSMFSYCWANKGSLGFVISQDGDIRTITRINDKLIMWENIRVLQFRQSKKLKRPLASKK